MDGVLPYDWKLVVHDQEGTHRVRGLNLAPGQTVEAYPGASVEWSNCQARTICCGRLGGGGAPVSWPRVYGHRVYSHRAYSPHSKGMYTRREARQPRPEVAATTTGAGGTNTGAGCTITGRGATKTGGGGATTATGNGSPSPMETCTPPACAESGRARLATAMQVASPKVRRSVLVRFIDMSSLFQDSCLFTIEIVP